MQLSKYNIYIKDDDKIHLQLAICFKTVSTSLLTSIIKLLLLFVLIL